MAKNGRAPNITVLMKFHTADRPRPYLIW